MADPARYRYTDTTGRRSPPLYNPARSSMPVTSGGYSSLYSGDLHAMSASHHEGLAPRAPDEYRTSAIPVSTTTYAVRKEPVVARSTGAHDSTRVHRVTDDNSKRPIIVTTKHHPASPRSGSPPRHGYRSSDDGPYYTQPASSIPRSRVTSHAPASASMDDEEYQRLKDRTHYDRLERRGGDSYRAPRPGSLYAGPNHRINTLEFDEEGYEYTKPSDLARYDLDHDQRRRPRRESLDRYYRPTVSISTDLTRPFDQTDRRVRGPPPTAWGLDKTNRSPAAGGGIYEGAGSRMPLPPQVPLAPEARPLNLLDALESPREEHRSTRPVSMYRDDRDRPGHRGPHYYDDDLTSRDTRDRDHEYYQDDSVAARGFGIRVSSDDFEDRRRPAEKQYHDGRRERREPQGRYEVREPRRRSDDDLEIVKHEYDERLHRRRHDRDYLVDGEARRDRKERRSDDDEPDSKKERLRDKVAAGLGIAAASLGVGSAVRDKDHEDRSPSRRHRQEETGRRDPDEVDARGKSSRREPLLGDEEFEIVEYPRDRERSENGTGVEPEARGSKRNGDAEASSSREHSASTDDDGKTRTRRRHRDSAFDPNDTAALAEMKARLAALKADEAARKTEQSGGDGKEAARIRESSPERRPSPVEKRDPDADASALVPRDNDKSRDERQVRVVPPPKETEKKPIKGILKPPRPQFPEEPNPVREGVAPHKDDKTKTNVPPGARWTKISRKMVNPEALKIGKERFEIRDDFVIVLRVLSKEEIQAYAAATATLRERRRKEYELEMKGEGEREGDRDDDDDKKTRNRPHRRDKDDDDRRDRDREKERHRRHRHESDSEVDDGDKHDERARHGGHHRSHRD